MTSSDALSVGQVYQGLRVVDVLNENELGSLYLANSSEHGQIFLRVVRRRVIEGAEELEQVEDALSRLEGLVHRNVARVLGGEENEGDFYYLLEAQSATTLFDLASHCRPFYEREVIWLGRGVSAGLAALHEAGLFHGGLLPSAVLIGHHGPIVLDLGWRDRFGGGGLEVCKRLDLTALRRLLVFSTSPKGGSPAFSPKLRRLLDRLGPDASDPFGSSREVAAAFKEQAQRLGLPDPMAPDSLQRLLERYEGAAPAPDASQEGAAFAPSGSGVVPTVPRPPKMPLQPLDPGESQDLDTSQSDGEALPLAPAPASSALESGPPTESDDLGASRGSEFGLASEEVRRDTMEYARGMLDEYPADPPSVEGGALPRVSDSYSLEGGEASGRSEEGSAPGLGPFGAFTLLEELRAARHSTLFLAERREGGRPLLLRVFLPGALPDEGARRRFLRGANAAEALQHPNLARVLDSGQVDEWVYLASELVGGQSLREALAREARLGARAPALIAAALRGLEHAHGMGVVHGGLSPDTVRVSEEGRAVLVDFGVPWVGKGGRPLPPTAYNPDPEAAEAGDVRALAVVLYEALTGSLPDEARGGLFAGSPPPPSVLTSGSPASLDAILLSALAGDYPGPGALAEDLEHLAGGAPRHARPLSFGRRVGRWLARRGSAVALLGVLLAGALTVLAGVGAADLLGLARPGLGRAAAAPSAAPSAGAQGSPAARPSAALPEALGEARAVWQRQRGELEAEARRLRAERAQLQRDLNEARGESDRLRSGLEHERRDQSQRLVELGESLLAAGNPRLAAGAFRQAQALIADHPGARSGLARAARAPAGGGSADERARRERAERHLREGRRHLSGQRFAEARSELLQAYAGGADEARPLLDQAQAGLLTARQEESTRRRRERNAARALELVQQAQSSQDPAEARARYLEALGLDPQNEAARAALSELPRPAPSAKPPPANAERRELALEAGQRHARRGRDLYTKERDLDAALDAYFQALHHYSRADAYDPRLPTAGAETERTVQELGAILRDDGQVAFANALYRFYGLDPKRAPAQRPPSDPHLVVEEAERTSIRRAFGGVVRFEPTRAFDSLRAWIRKEAPGSRIRIQVKSAIQPGFPPKVLAKGLWIRVEDRERKTISAPRRLEFEGGPYFRIVRVDSRGRVVLPFDRASTFEAGPYVEEAREIAKDLLRK